MRRQLEYKTKIYNSNLIVADRYYPSSQICSNCKNQQKISLKKEHLIVKIVGLILIET